MKNRFIIIMFFAFMFFSTTAYGATFKGKVIDTDTKEPVEGAVVVASWSESTATIAGGSQRLKDVKETLTDKNGEWEIRGPKGDRFIAQIFAMIPGIYYTEAPEFIIFKPGYCSWPAGFSIEACKKNMKGFDVEKTIELPKLTNREDRLRASAIWPSLMESDKESLKKIKIFLKLLDEENRSLGLSEDPRLKELEDEK